MISLLEDLDRRDLFEPACRIAKAEGCTVEEMFSSRRLPHLVRARTAFAVYLHNEGWSYYAIGRLLRHADHTTARRAIKARRAP